MKNEFILPLAVVCFFTGITAIVNALLHRRDSWKAPFPLKVVVRLSFRSGYFPATLMPAFDFVFGIVLVVTSIFLFVHFYTIQFS